MATEWKEPMAWENTGTAPSDTLKANGFKAGDKPPASVFNYFLNKTAECIDQLQDVADNHTHDAATTSAAGFMSATDKSKLDGIATGANKYTHPSYTAKTGVPTANATPAFGGTFSVTQPVSDATGHITAMNSRTVTIPSTAATTSEAGLMSATDKAKLDGIATGANAYTHPSYTARTGVPTANQTPAFGGTFSVSQPVSDATGHITAVTSRTVTIPSTAASTSAAGLMSAADKTKLDGIAENANAYTLPTASSTLGGVKTTSTVTSTSGLTACPIISGVPYYKDTNTTYTHPTTSGNKHIPSGGSSGQILRWSADGTAVWGADNNTTYSAATTSTDGLMSASDKTKLDGIATGATKVTVDSALSSSSTNPVQNKVVNTALGGKAPTSHASSATTYGIGTGSNYGHVKLSDSTSSTSAASAGIAASPAAVKAAYDLANTAKTTADGKAASGHTHDALSTPVTTSGTGAAYTATVAGITTLAAGVSFIMVTHTVSTTKTPTLNVNSLGAKGIRRRLSNAVGSVQSGYANGWLVSGKPFHVMYDGTYWIVQDLPKIAVADLYGTLPIAQGGTGATTVEGALENLGLSSLLSSGCKVATGSYVGTQYAYSGNSIVTLNFDFRPKLLFITFNGIETMEMSDEYETWEITKNFMAGSAVFMDGMDCGVLSYKHSGYNTSQEKTFANSIVEGIYISSWGDTTVNIGSTSSISEYGYSSCLNWNKATYHYVAIG